MGRRRKDGKFVNFYLATDLVDTLDDMSEETGKSKTRIIEDALSKHFSDNGFEVTRPVKTYEAHAPQLVEITSSASTEDIDKEQKLPKSEVSNIFLISDGGKIPCSILDSLTIYGEPYYRVEVDGEVKKVHRSMVEVEKG